MVHLVSDLRAAEHKHPVLWLFLLSLRLGFGLLALYFYSVQLIFALFHFDIWDQTFLLNEPEIFKRFEGKLFRKLVRVAYGSFLSIEKEEPVVVEQPGATLFLGNNEE